MSRAGQPVFWRQLVLLLHELVRFDNALVLYWVADGVPVVLEEFDAKATEQPSPVPLYLSGLYLLDPFWRACREGLADGLYRLSDVAPDLFRQSEYFQMYSRDAIGDDEMQVVLNLAPDAQLMLSVGTRARFSAEEFGCLTVCLPWVLALMRLHWERAAAVASPSPGPGPSLMSASQFQQALADFGAQVLSSREAEIAQLTLRGNSTKAIANSLSISVETVKVHRRHLYQKLGVSSQKELFSLLLEVLASSDKRQMPD